MSGQKLLTTKVSKMREESVMQLEQLAERTEAARDALQAELDVLIADAIALRGAVAIMLRDEILESASICPKCHASRPEGSDCDSCARIAGIKARARLRVA